MGHRQPRKLSKYGQGEEGAEKGRGVVLASAPTRATRGTSRRWGKRCGWLGSPRLRGWGLCSSQSLCSSPLLVGPQYPNLSRGPCLMNLPLVSRLQSWQSDDGDPCLSISLCSTCFLPGCPSCEFHLLPINQIPEMTSRRGRKPHWDKGLR